MSRRLPPLEEDLLLLAGTLEHYIPLDKDLTMEYHQSQKGYMSVRIHGCTSGRDWFLDAYRGPWFYLSVPPFEPVTADNLFSLISQLGVLLGKCE